MTPKHPSDKVRCECGLQALHVYETTPEGERRFVGYQCHQHGFLTHDAIVSEEP